MTLQRYDLEWTGLAYMQQAELVSRDNGEWCRYADVEPLIAALHRIDQTLRVPAAEYVPRNPPPHARRGRTMKPFRPTQDHIDAALEHLRRALDASDGKLPTDQDASNPHYRLGAMHANVEFAIGLLMNGNRWSAVKSPERIEAEPEKREAMAALERAELQQEAVST